jgi:hypothetical protein
MVATTFARRKTRKKISVYFFLHLDKIVRKV